MYEKEEDAIWRRYIRAQDRERTHDKFWHQSVGETPSTAGPHDRIYWCRWNLARLDFEFERQQQSLKTASSHAHFPVMNSAFIQFENQVAAHMACQSVSHHSPKIMTPRNVEIAPGDVRWNRLRIQWIEGWILNTLVLIVVCFMIAFLTVPVTFITALNKLSDLSVTTKWLHWAHKIPSKYLSMIQGTLPWFLTSLLTSIVPLILRSLLRLTGIPTGMQIELAVQRWFFAFLFVQIFLVVTVAGGIFSVVSATISNPLSISATLAQSLPMASNYFLSYLILQGLSDAASEILQLGRLLTVTVLASLQDNSARDKYLRQRSLPAIQWGSFFPIFTHLAVIGEHVWKMLISLR